MSSTILKKQLVAATGLLLCGFLAAHLAGNLLLFAGPRAFNVYAHRLTSSPLIYAAEAVLGLVFLVHAGTALRLAVLNLRARGGRGYALKRRTGRGATWASATMPWTGGVALVFVVLHVRALKFGPVHHATYGDETVRDLFRTCMDYFADPLVVAWYVAAMAAVSLHVWHGLWSAFQSLGINDAGFDARVRALSRCYAVCMGAGFSVLPVFCHLRGAAP